VVLVLQHRHLLLLPFLFFCVSVSPCSIECARASEYSEVCVAIGERAGKTSEERKGGERRVAWDRREERWDEEKERRDEGANGCEERERARRRDAEGAPGEEEVWKGEGGQRGRRSGGREGEEGAGGVYVREVWMWEREREVWMWEREQREGADGVYVREGAERGSGGAEREQREGVRDARMGEQW
jgi:hypothetical protein